MMSRGVKITWIHTGGYGQFRGDGLMAIPEQTYTVKTGEYEPGLRTCQAKICQLQEQEPF